MGTIIKRLGILSLLFFVLMGISLPELAFAKKSDFLHIYGDDEESWTKAEDELKKMSDIILIIYFYMPCKPKSGRGSGMIGFCIDKNHKLLPITLAKPVGPLPGAGCTSIPLDFKCGPCRGTGKVHINIKGRIIKRGKKKFLRFRMRREWDCIFKCDHPRYNPLHGKKCHNPPVDYGEYEIPLENGYITNYPGSIYNFVIETGNK